MTLTEICSKHKKGDWPDKGSVHSYLEVYEELLEPTYRLHANNILEIGLMSGESLRMWTEYFYDATVYGMDCDIRPHGGLADLAQAIGDGLNVRIGDATKAEDIDKLFNGVMFDVIIDDASHNIMDQLNAYYNFKPYMRKGGIYIIEDVQDLDANRSFFEAIDPDNKVEIIDLRPKKKRYDDVMIVIRF